MKGASQAEFRMSATKWLVLALLAWAISSLYMQRVLLPWRHFMEVDSGKLKAEMGDLYPRWVGTRELLFNGGNPYGPYVSHEIQMAFYGHAVVQDYEDPNAHLVDEQRFVYPLYVVFLLWPTAYLDFATVQQWAPPVLAMLTAMSVLLWMSALRWKPSRVLTTAIILFVIASPQVVQGLRLRQLGLLVAFFLALGTWCITRHKLAISGIVLAIATIKPQMAVLPLLWLLFWGLGDWRKRWSLLAAFVLTLALLIVAGQLLLPGWLVYFIGGLAAYRHYFQTTSLVCFLLGNTAGAVASAAILGGILVLGWRSRKSDFASPEFLYTTAMFFIGVTLILPLWTPYNQVLLLLPALMVLQDWALLPRMRRSIVVLMVVWPWCLSLVFLLHPPRLNSTSLVPVLPSAPVLLFPFFILLLCLTAWRRKNEMRRMQAPAASV